MPALAFLLAGFVDEYRRRGEGAMLVGILGIFLIFASTLLQQMRVDIRPLYFTHNAICHSLQGAALLMLFKSVGAFSSAVRRGPVGFSGWVG